MTHLNDELFSLLHGELDGPKTREVAAHLRSCSECAAELIDVAVASGSLAALARTNEELETFTPPVPSDIPALRPVRRVTGSRLFALAAAFLLVVGVGLAALTHHGTSPAPVATAQLTSLDAPSGAWGSARVILSGSSDQMTLTTTGLPAAGTGHFYEVWLYQPANGKMLPLGVLGPSGRGQYSVASSIMAHYSTIDVSLQLDNGDPRHSRVSALRGAVHPT
jgi:hypothetical protein